MNTNGFTIPPLPLVGNALVLDNSTIEQLQYCPRSYLIKYLKRRVPIVPSPGRNFGSALHEGWAVRYKTFGERRVNNNSEINDAITRYFLAHPQPENDFRNLDHALSYMLAYDNHYTEEPFKILATNDNKPMCERSFLLPMGSLGSIEVYYSGKLDLGIEDSTGLWVIDHKTAFQFGQSFEAEMASDTGQLGYAWAFRELFGTKPNGYITNACRVRRPKKGDEYVERAPVDSTDFRRLPRTVTNEDLDELHDTVMDWARALMHYQTAQRYPRVSGKRGCVGKYGLCDFYNICQAPSDSREGLLAGPDYEDNTWSPINKNQSNE